MLAARHVPQRRIPAHERRTRTIEFTRLDLVAVEALATMGYDFVCVDLLYGMLALDDMTAIAAVLSRGDTTPIVRVPLKDAAIIGRVLEAGVMGVITSHRHWIRARFQAAASPLA